ncbi:MAG: DUF222 domain-containing protein [Actinomycetota bacterium]
MSTAVDNASSGQCRLVGRGAQPDLWLSDLDRAFAALADAEAALGEAARLLAGFDGSGVDRWLGYVSMERMIAHRARSSNRSAVVFMRTVRFLARFPTTAASLQQGGLSWAQAEALATATTSEGLANAYSESEEQWLDLAAGCDVDELERRLRTWRHRVDTDLAAEDTERAWRQRSLTMQFALDGSCQGRFSLDAAGAETVWAALDTTPDPWHTLPEPRTEAQRRADTLIDVCAASLDGGLADTGDRPATPDRGVTTRATVDVVIDIETLAGTHPTDIGRIRSELVHGAPISGPGLDRLLCDASFRALITDGPHIVLAYNRATPDIPPGLRRAVRVRDRHCTFPGCDRPWWWCDLHHIVPRNRGGPTTAENLTLLCRHHHGTVHDHGWQLSRAPNGTIEVCSP